MVESNSAVEAPAPAVDGMDDAMMMDKNIVEVAQEAGSFNTLLAAVEAAGLVEALSTQEVTVFAPTDEAFAALPDGTVEGLLQDPEALANVLTYHVVPGTVMAEQVVGLDSAVTLQGQEVSINVTADGEVTVNEANVVTTDVEASNGVIHIIDAVLLPAQD